MKQKSIKNPVCLECDADEGGLKMFIKQIDEKTALELAAKGQEVMVLVPGEKEPKWESMMPDTLQKMLEGCMFFRREPAMEKGGIE